MQDEYPQGQDSYDDSIPVTGEENQQELELAETEEQEEAEETQEEQQPQVQTPVAAQKPATTTTTVPPATTETPTYQAPPPVGLSDSLKERLAVYLPEEDVKALGDEMRQMAVQVAQQALQGRDAQEQVASELGIPASYLPSVRRYMPQTQAAVSDPKQAVQAAVLMDLHERAARSGDLRGEMEKYVQAVDAMRGIPPATPTQPTTPSTPKPPPKVQPLHPDAQPTRSAIQSTTVRQPVTNRNTRGEDPLFAHFPGLKPSEEEGE